jgi:DNA-binding MarR family transcriptional regulator
MHEMRPMNLPDFALDESAPLEYQVFHQLRTVMQAHKHLMLKRLADKDTHPGQAMCLWVLAKNDGMSQRDLAQMLGVARPTVTIMLQKMEKAGLVERQSDEHDQRFTRIFITPAGKTLHEALGKVHAEVVAVTIGPMAETDQRELQRLLHVVEENIASAL